MKGYIDRHQFAEELILREHIRGFVKEVHSEKPAASKKGSNSEIKFDWKTF